jgi:putative salt-induced outer membrane protein YdiY
MTRRPPIVSLLLLAGMAAAAAHADEVVFKNGDRLTGTIKSADRETMTIESDVAGTVTVEMKTVATFATSEPAEVHLSDGSVLRQRVTAGDDGQIVTEGTDRVSGQRVALADVKAVNPAWGRWQGRVAAGGLVTRGNSHTDSFNATADAVRRTERDRFTVGAQYIYGRQDDDDTGGERTTNANAWLARAKYDYFVTPKLYPFASFWVERDKVAELDIRLVPSAGLGYQWVETKPLNFFTEAGLAWVYEDFEDEESTDHLAARLAYHVDWTPHDAVELFHDLEYLPSLEDAGDFNTYADAGLRVTLVAAMFAELRAEWRHDQTPAEDAERNDFRYLLAVGWEFE